MNDKIEKDVYKVQPLKKICMTIGELPTSYLETMTYYEMLVWFTNFLRDNIIPTVNNNAEAVQELQNLYEELRTYVNDYFDNLDVQEEINNKLDEMAEQGTLQEIIADYLNSKAIFGFDTVASMKTATNLIDGSYARTLGYFNENDGGGALYKIRTITNNDVVDNMFIIPMENNNLVAELIIINNKINILSMGVKRNDETFNSTNILQSIINKNLGYKIYFPYGIYYLTNINVDIGYHNVKLYGDSNIGNGDRSIGTHKTIFMPFSGMGGTMFTVGNPTTTQDNILYGFEMHNIAIKGGNSKYLFNAIDLGRTSNVYLSQLSLSYINGFALRLDGCYDSIFDNVEINVAGNKDVSALIMKGTIAATNAIRYNNCRIEACTRYLHLQKVFQLMFNNTKFEDNSLTDSTYPIIIDFNGDVTFNNCVFTSKPTQTEYFINFLNDSSHTFQLITRFIGCNFQCSGTNTNGGKYIKCSNARSQDVIIDGCYFYYPNTNNAISLNKSTFVNNAIFPFTFSDTNNNYIIEAKDNNIIKNNMFLGNDGTYQPFAIYLTGTDNIIKNNKYQNWVNTKLIGNISNYTNNDLDYRTLAITGSSISSSQIDALQSNIVQIPANTTIQSIINAWVGCELTLYSNGNNVVIDFTNIPLIYNYITSLTIPAGRTVKLRKATATQWVLISSND